MRLDLTGSIPIVCQNRVINERGQKRTMSDASPNDTNDQPDKCVIMSNQSPEASATAQLTAQLTGVGPPTQAAYGGQYYPPNLQLMTPQNYTYPGYQSTPQYPVTSQTPT
ncbi:hypothetical protein DPMN_159257 [Dreissena polymorpha]|uniref:Uncharacterized protein n=1 Tax=Dreissena polymorpha TaxID=45954 RepID=A0A9D4IP10_DREPO|nr:hypothetical protein DPMN_159257 [Dreissena polymorpha]